MEPDLGVGAPTHAVVYLWKLCSHWTDLKSGFFFLFALSLFHLQVGVVSSVIVPRS